MKRKSILSALSVSFFLTVIIVSYLSAPVQGTIKGVVTDKSGNPLEGARITIVSMQYSAVRYVLKSNKKGEFIQIGLQPDFYQIKAEKDGFFPVFLERRVGIMDIVEVNISMEEGKYYISEAPGDKDFKRGNESFQVGKYEEAVQAYQEAIKKEPGEPIYYNNQGICLNRLGRYEEAIEAFKKMLELQPESFNANKSIGELYGMLKKYEEALPFFVKATETSPNEPDAFYDLGACLINLQDYPKALKAFSRVKELKPDYANAYYQSGMIYINQNRKEEAIQNLEKFLELAPEDTNATLARQILDYLKKNIP
jgi:tetratricopeptide (TPR) repeat protein